MPEFLRHSSDHTLHWKVHTSRLLDEITTHSGQPSLRIPLNTFRCLLADVGECAARLNDPQLNALMCKLTIYSIADPDSPDYDAAAVERIVKEGNIT